MTIGPKIRVLRKERGFTLSKLASKLNVSSAFLSNLERGLKQPSITTLKRISQVLNTSVSYLLEVPPEKSVGKKLRFLRQARGLTLEVLSEISELSTEEIEGIEEGVLTPDLSCLEKLSSALNYSIRYFLDNPGTSSSLGTRLNSLRKQHNLSIKELADLAGVSPGLISQIENDKTVPLLDTLESIANSLHTDSSYFLLDAQDTEALYYSLSVDVRKMLENPKVQAMLRASRDFTVEELNHLLDYIHNFKKHTTF